MLVGNAVPLPRAVGHVVLTVASLLLAHALATVVAHAVAAATALTPGQDAGGTGGDGTYVATRVGLGLLLVVGVVRWRTGSALAAGLPGLRWAGGPALATYAALPAAWAGAAFVGWQVSDLAVVAWGADLALWAGAVGVGVLWAGAQVPLRDAPLTPYG